MHLLPQDIGRAVLRRVERYPFLNVECAFYDEGPLTTEVVFRVAKVSQSCHSGDRPPPAKSASACDIPTGGSMNETSQT